MLIFFNIQKNKKMLKKNKLNNFQSLKLDIFLKLIEIAKNNNFELFIVGGQVRDLLLAIENLVNIKNHFEVLNIFKNDSKLILERMLDNENFDFDFVVHSKFDKNKNSIYLAEILKQEIDCEENLKLYLTKNEKFKTVNINVELKNEIKFNFDIATMRTEKYAFSGALPDVEVTDDFFCDIIRRDISINSIAVKLTENVEIIDLLNGIDDLICRKIKLNYENSLEDDPTRIFRIIKFATRFNFEFDKETEAQLRLAANKKFYKNISKTRILNEFKKVFAEDFKAIKNFVEIIHFYGFDLAINEKFLSHNFEDFYKNLENFSKLEKNLNQKNIIFEKWFLCFLLFIKDLDYFEIEKVAKDFSFSKYQKEDILKLENLDKFESLVSMKDSEVYFLLQKYSLNFMSMLMILFLETKIFEKILKYITKTKYIRLKINGDILIKDFGCEPKKINQILNSILSYKIDFDMSDLELEEEKNFVEKILSNQT
jgi:tRNA nucleotidyltransferase (CCA-adding enzyme)